MPPSSACRSCRFGSAHFRRRGDCSQQVAPLVSSSSVRLLGVGVLFFGGTSSVGERSSECCDFAPRHLAIDFAVLFPLAFPEVSGGLPNVIPFSVSTAGCSWSCSGTDTIRSSDLQCQGSSRYLPQDFSMCTHVTSMCVFFPFHASSKNGSGIFTKLR